MEEDSHDFNIFREVYYNEMTELFSEIETTGER